MENEEVMEKIWEDLSPEAKRLIGQVIQIEKSKKHLTRAYNVNNEILEALEEVTK